MRPWGRSVEMAPPEHVRGTVLGADPPAGDGRKRHCGSVASTTLLVYYL